jgi:hypothetical protein
LPKKPGAVDGSEPAGWFLDARGGAHAALGIARNEEKICPLVPGLDV